jgi:hypothetical protein
VGVSRPDDLAGGFDSRFDVAVAAPRPKVAARWAASRALAKIVQKNWQEMMWILR